MDYQDLQDTIAGWIDRDDMTEDIRKAIKFAEREINRELRVQDQEGMYTIDGADTDYYVIPEDQRGFRSVSIDGDVVRYQTPFGMLTTPLNYGEPENDQTVWFYTLAGDQIIFNGDVSSDSMIELTGYLQVPTLTDAAPTNWLLESHEDCYFNGGMKYAYLKAKDYTSSQLWESGFSSSIESIKLADKRDRWSGAPMSMVSDTRYKNRGRNYYGT